VEGCVSRLQLRHYNEVGQSCQIMTAGDSDTEPERHATSGFFCVHTPSAPETGTWGFFLPWGQWGEQDGHGTLPAD
jgi:hypothetical protein